MTGRPRDIQPGEIYEDCAFHPVLCTHNDGETVNGISLIDGTSPRSCDLVYCDVIKLSIAEVIEIKADWPGYVARRSEEYRLEGGGTTHDAPGAIED